MLQSLPSAGRAHGGGWKLLSTDQRAVSLVPTPALGTRGQHKRGNDVTSRLSDALSQKTVQRRDQLSFHRRFTREPTARN